MTAQSLYIVCQLTGKAGNGRIGIVWLFLNAGFLARG